MPNIASAKKALRVNKRRNKINTRNKVAYRTARKKVLDTLNAGKVKEAQKDLVLAYSALDMAVKKGAIKKNTASRYKSRLSKAIKRADTAK